MTTALFFMDIVGLLLVACGSTGAQFLSMETIVWSFRSDPF